MILINLYCIVLSITSMSVYDFFQSLFYSSWNSRNVEQVAYNE